MAWHSQSRLLPCGAAGAVLVAAWRVEAKQGVIETMAPVLTSEQCGEECDDGLADHVSGIR